MWSGSRQRAGGWAVPAELWGGRSLCLSSEPRVLFPLSGLAPVFSFVGLFLINKQFLEVSVYKQIEQEVRVLPAPGHPPYCIKSGIAQAPLLRRRRGNCH